MSAASSQASDREQRIPRLAPECDPTRLELTPAEGFLLSRIDGATTLAVLRQIGGLSPDEVGRCVERWLADGVLTLAGGGRPPGATPRPPPEPAAGDAPGIDPALDLDVEIQRRVIEFEARLDAPYHEILGVARDADARVIKKAYFALSRAFHPDRYFRREIGGYEARIARIWRRILEAYELLSDPQTRAEVEKSQAEAQREPAGPTHAGRDVRMLMARMRMVGRAPAADARKEKARTFFESGMKAFDEERWIEAAGSVRLAIAFDPRNEEFRAAFGTVQQRAHEERAAQLSKEANGAYDLGEYRDALRLYEEAAHYRPCDAELHWKTGRLAWKLGEDLRRAKEFAANACELEPDNALYRRTLGQIFQAAGLEANARRELQAAVRLDPKDAEARQALREL